MGSVSLRGGWEGGGVPMPGGTLRGSDQGGAPSEHFPCPISPRSLHGSQAGSSSFRGPLQAMLVLGA